ncbi:MAG: ROK family protein [Chitinophagaceae bacterium]|nr:ROK family protein [Chitinophagaceae bacterium]
MQYSIGIDIGGTNSMMGIVDKMGNILFEAELITNDYELIEDFADACYKLLYPEINKLGFQEFRGIGIGAPNGNYYQGTIEFAPNLRWKGVVPLAKIFSQKFNLNTTVTNDANAAAIGEMMHGAAKGMNDFIMVTLGTGVGSGFVANGKMMYGHDGFAGELGHTIAVRDGRLCGCGRKGCLETYTSATGIVRTANEFLETKTNSSSLRNLTTITSKNIYDAAVKGDFLALEIFEFTGKILGQSLADVIAITSPEAIILFGGLAQAGKFIFEPTRKYMEQNLLKIYQGKVKLLPSELKESDAAILGAASLIWNTDKALV